MAQVTKAESRSIDKLGNYQDGNQQSAITIVAATSSSASESHSLTGVNTTDLVGLENALNANGTIINEVRTDVDSLIVAVNDLRLAMQAHGKIAGST